MNTALRQFCLPVAVLAALGLSACGGSSKDTTAPARATGAVSSSASTSGSVAASTSASSTPSPSPTPSPTGLSKAQFVAKMNAVCTDFDAKLRRLPDPSTTNNYADLITSAEGTLKLFPQYMEQAEALVNKSGDKASLTAHWLSVERSDFAATEPALKKFIADIKAKNQGALAADGKALEKAPDHSEDIARFMSGYGLKSCAKLESS